MKLNKASNSSNETCSTGTSGNQTSGSVKKPSGCGCGSANEKEMDINLNQ